VVNHFGMAPAILDSMSTIPSMFEQRPFVIDPEHNVIRVCAHCFPNERIYFTRPELEFLDGFTISHGICNFHARSMVREAGLLPKRNTEIS